MPALCRHLETSVAVPELSVVIASVNGWSALAPTLDALDIASRARRMEVIVVETVGGGCRERLRQEYPSVVVVESPRPAIPRLRYQGVICATGRLVAILEDHAEVRAGLGRINPRRPRRSVGRRGRGRRERQAGLVNWAVFFCEYAAYMAPVAEGERTTCPATTSPTSGPICSGTPTCWSRGSGSRGSTTAPRADGVPIASTNAMVVRHIKPFRLGYFLVQRFHFARSYAGMRRVDQSWPKRLVYGLGSLILPVLLTARLTRTVLAKRRHLARFVLVLPLVVLFLTVGAVGEMVGYLFGPGDSLEKVE